jgi:predicted nucleotidyltransferase
LSAADFARLQALKVNEGRFAGRPYFIRFVKLPDETPERFGDPRFAPVGLTLVEARVTDDRDALFTPCRYQVDEVRSLDGVRANGLREVISYRGRFAEQARVGQRVRAYGALERAIWRDGNETLRLVVGSRQGDYLLGLEDDSAAERPPDPEPDR